ncbi:alpha,alpha-trehalase TreF [Pinibacter soli]|uniref:Alpha,alpha-trehalase TreF n=1 Tax=Pinibacter soli TaxID=3044211 RepID=A0ABT6RI19_9BACT|nr:alpha,alpha-trehalase TreF [Pinibacter soli]MDI3322222.1 alpha,alpha-trehalase TreF [Pinibacter soli]
MKRMIYSMAIPLSIALSANAQDTIPPDKLYGELFVDVQMNRIFPDGKTFVDCTAKRSPAAIVEDYTKIKKAPTADFSLKKFVEDNFDLPLAPSDNYKTDKNADVQTHIKQLWQVLKRNPDKTVAGSTLLPLPNSYIVPGGRFREVYYWDSYFTMLGLEASGETAMIENLVNNFSWLLSQYGHVPNGNRTYYLSRSQPPFFSLMLDLLAKKSGDKVYAEYQRPLQSEYDYWMDKTAPTKHVVKMPNGDVLNRYYDQYETPRQESYREDVELGAKANEAVKKARYRSLRSAAESGWDFSTRWFADGKNISTIETTNFLPVDLNCLLYHLEITLSKSYKATGDLLRANLYTQIAEKRKTAINKYLFNAADGWYYDYNISGKALSNSMTIAGITPFYFALAPKERIEKAAGIVEKKFLKPGGVVTTLKNSGQQWDAPNGWAPLEWMAIKGLEQYGKNDLAKEIAKRWIDLNVKVYKATGKMMEKYNVENIDATAGGGEYPSQDGFGWTNGVLMQLMKEYPTP